MRMIHALLLKKSSDISTRNHFTWNMIGSLAFAASTIILTILTTRIMGDSYGGEFAIALATGQVMASIGYYEVRTIQVTDIRNTFAFDDYFYHRLLTNIIMLLCSIGFIISKGYTFDKASLIFLVCIWKMLDTFADVYEGLFQKSERLDIAGKSLSIRTILTTCIFIIVLMFSQNMYLASLLSIASSLLCIYLLNIGLRKEFVAHKLKLDVQKIKQLCIDCFPLFAGVFMFTYIANASRYAIDEVLNANMVAYFTAIFLPVSTINLVSGFIFKPLLTTLAVRWNKDTNRQFIGLILKFFGIIVLLTLTAIAGAYVLGIPVLSLVYGIDLADFKGELLILLIGGGCSAFSTIEFYCLAVMRHQMSIFVCYLIVFLTSLILPMYFVQTYGISGGAWSYTILMFLIAVCFGLCIFYSIAKRKRP